MQSRKDWKWRITFGVSVLGLLVPIILFGIARETKILSYKVLSGIIYSKDDPVKVEKVKVTYENKVLDNLYYQVVYFRNDGSTPIKREDYDRDIAIIYPNETRLLSVKVIDSKNDNNEIRLKVANNQINIEPVLLNKKDYFTIQAITTGKQHDPRIIARVVGITDKLSKNKYHDRFGIFLMTIWFMAAFFCGSFMCLYMFRRVVIVDRFVVMVLVFLVAVMSLTSKFYGLMEIEYISGKFVRYISLSIMLFSAALGYIITGRFFIYRFKRNKPTTAIITNHDT